MLNGFLRVMVDVVETRHNGIINKFLGDGFMALFGIGVDAENHADEALATGRDMLSALDELNATLCLGRGASRTAIGIGIHTGPAIVGSIGSPERLEFTAIGSAVNIASRIEALTKTVQRPLLLTEATAQHLIDKTPLEELPPQPVRGVDEADASLFRQGSLRSEGNRLRTSQRRFSRRIISFNPDHVSSTAQTFTSTKPSGNATSRITSSVTSVADAGRFLRPRNPKDSGVRDQACAAASIPFRALCVLKRKGEQSRPQPRLSW